MADDLLAAFTVGLSVTKKENDTSGVHPRFDEYKGRYVRSGDQENRRADVLERQKKKRFDAVNYARKLADGDLLKEEVEEVSMENDESPTKEKRFNPYKNQLMLSEWIVDPPPDLEQNWIMVPCPVGKRRLVVAHKGYTCAYTKSGYLHNSFPSALPGGSFKTQRQRGNSLSSYTIVDCIYEEKSRTFWMIDLMCLNGRPIYDSDTEFRFFWLNSKLQEDAPMAKEQSNANPFKFIPLENFPCNADAVVESLSQMHSFEIDGVLFFHKSTHYTPGRTPLVGWLKPYMLPEILKISVPEALLETAPVQFNRDILVEANKDLQNTVSDRSFNNPGKKENTKNEQKENEVVKNDS